MDEVVGEVGGTGGRFGTLPDRALYALFSRHADSDRHVADRQRYRATRVTISFDVYLARVYGLSWLACILVFASTFALAATLPDATVVAILSFVREGLPVVDRIDAPSISRTSAATGIALLAAIGVKRGAIVLGGRYLAWAADARRTNIERTLPGAVRYLTALSTGSDDVRAMLEKVADRESAYGETAVAFRKILNKAALTGSPNRGMSLVARDTPSRELLAPFLLKFREHANQGSDALAGYLRMEGRMLAQRQARARQQAQGFLELVAEMFVVLLVLPALMVIVLTVMSVLAPGLGEPLITPFGTTTIRAVLVYGSAAFILVIGAGTSALLASLRPPDQSPPERERGPTVLEVLTTTFRNPANASIVFVPIAFGAAGLLWWLEYRPVTVALLAYVTYALPVGLVAVRRARIDDAKDRQVKDFIHAVSGHVSLGRPFAGAVELVARDVDLGPLSADVADLAFNVNLTTHEGEVRAAALNQFVERVGTPLADQTIGLVTGALDVGGDAEDVFETLQVEIGRLYHEKKALRANMLVYVAVGWTTALLVIAIMVSVNAYVLDSFAQLSTLSSAGHGVAIDPNAVDPGRDRFRFYVVTQATMLACGWFAGMASRGRYEALLHSGSLVAIAYFVRDDNPLMDVLGSNEVGTPSLLPSVYSCENRQFG